MINQKMNEENKIGLIKLDNKSSTLLRVISIYFRYEGLSEFNEILFTASLVSVPFNSSTLEVYEDIVTSTEEVPNTSFLNLLEVHFEKLFNWGKDYFDYLFSEDLFLELKEQILEILEIQGCVPKAGDDEDAFFESLDYMTSLSEDDLHLLSEILEDKFGIKWKMEKRKTNIVFN